MTGVDPFGEKTRGLSIDAFEEDTLSIDQMPEAVEQLRWIDHLRFCRITGAECDRFCQEVDALQAQGFSFSEVTEKLEPQIRALSDQIIGV